MTMPRSGGRDHAGSVGIGLTVLLLALFLGAAPSLAQVECRGEIQFSDGVTRTGVFYLSQGRKFKIHHREGVAEYSLDQIKEIRFFPEKEELIQKWTFPEAGKTRKTRNGEPYPIRYLRCKITRVTGDQQEGLLYSTVIYLRTNGHTDKVRLMSKLRGKPGQRLEDLKYPKIISFETGDDRDSNLECPIPANVGKPLSLTAISEPDLIRNELHRDPHGNILLPSGMSQIAIGVLTHEKIIVYWPHSDEAGLTPLINKELIHVKDFFDKRQLLAVARPQKGGDVFTLMLLSRTGKTTLAGQKSQPWRLEAWRWKYDETQQQQLLLAGRGYFFRGIDVKDAEPPRIEIRNRLFWQKDDLIDSP